MSLADVVKNLALFIFNSPDGRITRDSPSSLLTTLKLSLALLTVKVLNPAPSPEVLPVILVKNEKRLSALHNGFVTRKHRRRPDRNNNHAAAAKARKRYSIDETTSFWCPCVAQRSRRQEEQRATLPSPTAYSVRPKRSPRR